MNGRPGGKSGGRPGGKSGGRYGGRNTGTSKGHHGSGPMEDPRGYRGLQSEGKARRGGRDRDMEWRARMAAYRGMSRRW